MPHLPPGVARVRQDHRNPAQVPPLPRAVPIPPRIHTRRTRNTTLVQLPRDPRHTAPGEPLGEHPPHIRGSHRIRIQPLPPPSPGSMRPVRMRTRIDQPIPIRLPTAQKPALLDRLHHHRRQRPMPRPHYLPLRLRRQHLHQRAMQRIIQTHRSTRLRQPHLDPSLLQNTRDMLKLAVGECPLELAHHHRIERPISRSRPLQERRRLRTPLPSHPPRTAHIEELRSDRPAPRDQRRGHLPLPRARRGGILKLRRRCPPIECESHALDGRSRQRADTPRSRAPPASPAP
jgi:hypothetical protein